MDLMIIRHGQSANNLLFTTSGSYVGRSPDPLLSDVGAHQAQLLADAFAAGRLPRPDVLTCSLMARAVQTAHIIAETLDLPLVGRLDSYEIGGPYLGDSAISDAKTRHLRSPYHGAPRADLEALSNRLLVPEPVTDAGWYFGEIEDPADAPSRARAVLTDLQRTYPDRRVALVCHQEFGQALFAAALGLSDEAPASFQLDNTSTSLFRLSADNTHVAWLNNTDHLPASEVTN